MGTPRPIHPVRLLIPNFGLAATCIWATYYVMTHASMSSFSNKTAVVHVVVSLAGGALVVLGTRNTRDAKPALTFGILLVTLGLGFAWLYWGHDLQMSLLILTLITWFLRWNYVNAKNAQRRPQSPRSPIDDEVVPQPVEQPRKISLFDQDELEPEPVA